MPNFHSLLESIHLSALIACRWRALARQGELVIPGGKRYWIASRTRLERWARWSRYFQQVNRQGTMNDFRRSQFISFAHEVLVTDLVTRMWASTSMVIDRHHTMRELEPYAGSIFVSHMDIRQRTLKTFAECSNWSEAQRQQLDSMRKRVERWMDLLLSFLADEMNTDAWSFDAERVADFALSTTMRHDPEVLGTLIFGSLQASFDSAASVRALHPELNHRIVSALLSAFGSDAIDATGVFGSMWESRLANRASDVEILISDLTRDDEEPYV